MKVLLTQTIERTGIVGEVIEVSSGFARNYLLPKGLAVEPTKNNLKKVEARRQEIEKQEREKREQQERLLKKLEGKDVTLERKANDQGHLYGAVSATDIARQLQADGFNVEAEDVLLPGKLDQINTYTVKIRFAEDLETDLKIYVAPDAESKAAIDAAHKASADAAKAEEAQNA
jgi:large subunit ribosomal protein L9